MLSLFGDLAFRQFSRKVNRYTTLRYEFTSLDVWGQNGINGCKNKNKILQFYYNCPLIIKRFNKLFTAQLVSKVYLIC